VNAQAVRLSGRVLKMLHACPPYLEGYPLPLLSSTKCLSSAAFRPGPIGIRTKVPPLLSTKGAAAAEPVGLEKPMMGRVLPVLAGGLWLRCCQLGPSSLSHTKHLGHTSMVLIVSNPDALLLCKECFHAPVASLQAAEGRTKCIWSLQDINLDITSHGADVNIRCIDVEKFDLSCAL
jgi:hypothetical protein